MRPRLRKKEAPDPLEFWLGGLKAWAKHRKRGLKGLAVQVT